jgi:PEP-CTERM motif-containing protein
VNRRIARRASVTLTVFGLVFGLLSCSWAGNVFVTGHDPDFHASLGGNAAGAQNIIARGLDFARNGNTAPILYLQSNTDNTPLGDHTDSEQGLIATGYSAGNLTGNHYVKVNATQFASANLGDFSALFVPSDHGGSLTGDDLTALNARAADIQAYVNSGGGLVALAEDGFRTPASVGPQPTNFGFLPVLASAAALSQGEAGFTVTPYGAGLGLTNADINGNASHCIFTSFAGFNVVDQDAQGNVISIALSGSIPEPSTISLMAVCGALFGLCQCRRGR